MGCFSSKPDMRPPTKYGMAWKYDAFAHPPPLQKGRRHQSHGHCLTQQELFELGIGRPPQTFLGPAPTDHPTWSGPIPKPHILILMNGRKVYPPGVGNPVEGLVPGNPTDGSVNGTVSVYGSGASQWGGMQQATLGTFEGSASAFKGPGHTLGGPPRGSFKLSQTTQQMAQMGYKKRARPGGSVRHSRNQGA